MNIIEDRFLLYWRAFYNAHESLKFFSMSHPDRKELLDEIRKTRLSHAKKLSDLCVSLGDEKCRDLIGGVAYCHLRQNMKEVNHEID